MHRSSSQLHLHQPNALQLELAEIRNELDIIRVELELLIKTHSEETATSERCVYIRDNRTPEERILEKMLEAPYQSMFGHSSSSSSKDNETQPSTSNMHIALAPQRMLLYKEILLPQINLNSIASLERAKLKTLAFDVLPFKDSKDELHVIMLLMEMFHELGLVATFKIPEANLYRFFMHISRRYREVPFHNFFHAFNVTQTMYFFIQSCKAKDVLRPLEIFALLIACICHDTDHPGLNNDFQKKAHTRIAHFHKKSILENHHYLQCMAALSKSYSNILIGLTPEQEETFYLHLRNLILATDLAVHGHILKSLGDRKKVLHKAWKHADPNSLSEEDRQIIMCALIKCADLSNEIRQQHIAQRWAKMVIEEFFMQSDKEREMGLPVTAFMDKHKIIIAKEQINFIEKLCFPLYVQISAVFPLMDVCCRQLSDNLEGWQARLRNFFAQDAEQLKNLSNKSLWERKQAKGKGSLSSILAMRASNNQVVKPTKSKVPSTANGTTPNNNNTHQTATNNNGHNNLSTSHSSSRPIIFSKRRSFLGLNL